MKEDIYKRLEQNSCPSFWNNTGFIDNETDFVLGPNSNLKTLSNSNEVQNLISQYAIYDLSSYSDKIISNSYTNNNTGNTFAKPFSFLDSRLI